MLHLTPHKTCGRAALLRLFALLLSAVVLLTLAGCSGSEHTDLPTVGTIVWPDGFPRPDGDDLIDFSTLDSRPAVPTPDSSSVDSDSHSAPDSQPDSGPIPDSSSQSAVSSESVPSSQPNTSTGDPAVNELSRWHYDRLDTASQQLYRQMYEILHAHAASGPVTPIAEEKIHPAFLALCADHPEMFWCSRYEYSYKTVGGSMSELLFIPTYELSLADRQAYEAQLLPLRDSLMAALPAGADDYTKALQLYVWLANNTTYVTGAPLNQTLVSALLLQESVCAGYARSMQYLLHAAGIPCTYLSGHSRNESHGWNLAQLDGDLYYMDPTWGDSDIDSRTADGTPTQLICYEYFTMTYEQLLISHVPDIADIPVCTAVKNLYFTRENLQFDSWDPTAVQDRLTAAAAAGKTDLSLYFTNKTAYDTAFAALERGDFYGMLQRTAETTTALATDSLNYFYNNEHHVLMVALEYH